MDDPRRAEYEQRFRRAGLPLLIEGFSAREDVFTRAYPLLALVFTAEVLGALNLEWSAAANVAAVAGAVAVLLAGVAVANRLAGRRALAVPREVGPIELGAFVMLPAALPLLFGGQVTSALVTAGGNAALLLAIYLVVGLGFVSIVRWAGRRLAGQLASSLLLLARAIPLLLLFAVVLFINTEMWQTFGGIDDPALVAFTGLLIGIGTLFLVVRLPKEVAQLEREGGAGPPLEPGQRLNVGLVMFVSQALQVLLVSAATGAFFVALGALLITPEIIDSWTGTRGQELLEVDVLGVDARLTAELLRVSAGLSALTGLYYAIAMLTDSTYRAEFLDEITAEMRETFKARAEYLEDSVARGAR